MWQFMLAAFIAAVWGERGINIAAIIVLIIALSIPASIFYFFVLPSQLWAEL